MKIMIRVVNLGFTIFYYKVKSRTQFWIGHFFKDYKMYAVFQVFFHKKVLAILGFSKKTRDLKLI